MENYIKSFKEFLNESSRFGVPFDPKASTYDTQYPTKTMRAPRFSLSKGVTQRELNLNTDGVRLEELKKFDRYVNNGLKIIKDFVDKTDFSQFMFKGERSSDGDTNFEDKAYIYHTLTGYLGSYSQYGIKADDVAYIGMVGNLKDFKVSNRNWAGKFASGATESFPEKRPQLIFTYEKGFDNQDVRTRIFKELPSLKNYNIMEMF